MEARPGDLNNYRLGNLLRTVCGEREHQGKGFHRFSQIGMDNTDSSGNRLHLPADVAHGSQMTAPVNLRNPPQIREDQ